MSDLCLAKFDPYVRSEICRECRATKKDNNYPCYHRTPWNIDEEEALEKQKKSEVSDE